MDRAIKSSVVNLLHGIGITLGDPHPITRGLSLINSPAPVIISAGLYLVIVSVWAASIKRSGLQPRTEEPLALKFLIIAHNLFLCGLSLYMGAGIAYQAWRKRYSILGNYVKDDELQMGHLIYIFYVSKLYEFTDTVIMLLKRNLRQVSYLHVYHHASICIIWWLMAYVCPGGDAYFSALFNSWIHVVMYLYYLLAALIGKNEKLRRKYLFWSKYLTMLQMLQFVSFIGQSIFGLFRPQYYPPGLCRLLFFYSLSLLLFFAHFFFEKHGKSSTRSNTVDFNEKKGN